jgi:hypothetical protein
MAKELGQKNEEIRKYHVEQAVVFNQIRELVGHPGEVVAKTQLYDQLGEEGDPKSTKQAIPVLVKYARRITNLFAEIQKVLPPIGTPRRVLYQGTPGSPSGTLYEVVGEVTVLQEATDADPSQQKDDLRPESSGRDPERTHSSGARQKSTGSAVAGSTRSGRGQSPAPRKSDRSRTPDRVRSPIRHQTPDPKASRDKGKAHALSTTPTFPADYPMPEQLLTPPSKTTSAREPHVSSGGRHSEQPAGKSPTPSPGIRKGTVFGTPSPRHRERRRQATRRMRSLHPRT